MTAKQIVPGLHAIPLGGVNAFLLEAADGLTLIDTGTPGSAPKILAAVRSLGKQPEDIQHILVTHCHYDHAGSLAELKQTTGAPAYMHPADAALVAAGQSARFLKPAPGLLMGLLFRLFIGIKPLPPIPPATIEQEVNDGAELPIAGGIRAIHVPGHCAGQLAFLWPRHGGVLFAADTASNIVGLGWSIGYEELEEGKRSLAKLSKLNFEVACFGHGGTITKGASERFRQKWE